MAARRRHQPVVGISGLLLFVCMFVPAVRSCGTSVVVPLELPPVIPPYLLGLGFAIAASVRSEDGFKGSVIYLRVVSILFLTECLIGIAYWFAFGIVVVLAPAAILLVLGLTGYARGRVAVACIVTGVASAIWFGLFCADKDALIGVWVSLGSSIGLVLGGIVWLVDLHGRDEAALPTATVISSGE